jgi:pimeloyl-ACP methyl ester carboxylesterase
MTPLVLLPGMMCDARLYAPQIAAFSATRPVHCAPIGAHDSMQALARDVLENAPPRFALAGLSMGGIVAMEVMAQAPERVTHLALLDTNPRAELPDVQARRGPQIDAVQNGHLREVMRDEMKPNYLIDSPNKSAILDTCMDMAMTLGADVFSRQSRALRDRPDQQETLRDVAVPTIILCGAEDRLCPLERHELMHALIPGSRLTVIENAAHLPTLEQPDAVNAALAKWLED